MLVVTSLYLKMNKCADRDALIPYGSKDHQVDSDIRLSLASLRN